MLFLVSGEQTHPVTRLIPYCIHPNLRRKRFAFAVAPRWKGASIDAAEGSTGLHGRGAGNPRPTVISPPVLKCSRNPLGIVEFPFFNVLRFGLGTYLIPRSRTYSDESSCEYHIRLEAKDDKMVDEAIARKARLILERAGIAAEDQVFSSSKEMKNK
jgi:hypothetical protein